MMKRRISKSGRKDVSGIMDKIEDEGQHTTSLSLSLSLPNVKIRNINLSSVFCHFTYITLLSGKIRKGKRFSRVEKTSYGIRKKLMRRKMRKSWVTRGGIRTGKVQVEKREGEGEVRVSCPYRQQNFQKDH